MAKRKSVKKQKGHGVALAGGKRRQHGKGFVGDLARSQGPSIAGSVLGELIKMGLSRMLAGKN